jgi:hypothetical protein
MQTCNAEEILRRIEVKRIFEQPDQFYALGEILEISKEFMSYSVFCEDWRFLNAALKLNDWLRLKGTLNNEVEEMENQAIATLRVKCGLGGNPE